MRVVNARGWALEWLLLVLLEEVKCRGGPGPAVGKLKPDELFADMRIRGTPSE